MNFFFPKQTVGMLILREIENITDSILLKRAQGSLLSATGVYVFNRNNFGEFQVLPVVEFSFDALAP